MKAQALRRGATHEATINGNHSKGATVVRHIRNPKEGTERCGFTI